MYTDPSLLDMMRQDMERILSKSKIIEKENIKYQGNYKWFLITTINC